MSRIFSTNVGRDNFISDYERGKHLDGGQPMRQCYINCLYEQLEELSHSTVVNINSILNDGMKTSVRMWLRVQSMRCVALLKKLERAQNGDGHG